LLTAELKLGQKARDWPGLPHNFLRPSTAAGNVAAIVASCVCRR